MRTLVKLLLEIAELTWSKRKHEKTKEMQGRSDLPHLISKTCKISKSKAFSSYSLLSPLQNHSPNIFLSRFFAAHLDDVGCQQLRKQSLEVDAAGNLRACSSHNSNTFLVATMAESTFFFFFYHLCEYTDGDNRNGFGDL